MADPVRKLDRTRRDARRFAADARDLLARGRKRLDERTRPHRGGHRRGRGCREGRRPGAALGRAPRPRRAVGRAPREAREVPLARVPRGRRARRRRRPRPARRGDGGLPHPLGLHGPDAAGGGSRARLEARLRLEDPVHPGADRGRAATARGRGRLREPADSGRAGREAGGGRPRGRGRAPRGGPVGRRVPQPRTPDGDASYDDRSEGGGALRRETCRRFREALARGPLAPPPTAIRGAGGGLAGWRGGGGRERRRPAVPARARRAGGRRPRSSHPATSSSSGTTAIGPRTAAAPEAGRCRSSGWKAG